MCIRGLEIEKREQDDVPRLVHRRESATSPFIPVGEVIRERRGSETLIIPIRPEELYGRHSWIPGGRPLVVEITSSRSSATGIEVDAGCGAFFLMVEDNLVKQKRCTRRHRCQKCRDRSSRKKEQPKKDGDSGNIVDRKGKDRSEQERRDHQETESPCHHTHKEISALHSLINRIADLLKGRGERDQEWRQLRDELQKIKAEERAEGRKLEHIERLLEDVAASPIPSSPAPTGHAHQHRHLRHHEPCCRCHHCSPPRAPPSTPSTWQGPYGCEPPKCSIPAGKRTHKHHEHRERKRHREERQGEKPESHLGESTITTGSGSTSSSRASQIARESFDRIRNFAMRQSRKLKAMDARLDATNARVDVVDGKATKAEEKVQQVDNSVKDATSTAHKASQRAEAAENSLKSTNERVNGLGIRLDDGFARTEVLGVQMKQVENRASMAQSGMHQLEIKAAALGVQAQMQHADTSALTQRVGSIKEAMEGTDARQREDVNILNRRLETMESDVDAIDARQRSEERRNEERWREVGRGALRGVFPAPWQWTGRRPAGAGGPTVEVEVEEEIDIERTERVRRTKNRSSEGHARRDTVSREQDEGTRLSYTRRRGNGRAGKFTLKRK